MKYLATTLMAAIAAVLLASSAHATVLTFDDVSVQNGAWLPTGYGGLSWSNLAIATRFSYRDVNTTGMGTDVGYYTGVVSGADTVFNSAGLLARISSDTDFDFEGAFFTSAWSDKNMLTAKGYSNGKLLYTKTLAINTKAPTWFAANFSDIDELTLTTSRWQFAMDNLTFDFQPLSTPQPAVMAEMHPAPVPEPASLLLVGAGLLCVGLARKRRERL